MQAPSTPFPRIGEWYSYDDLFHDFPDYWVLLAYPRELTPEEDWDLMGTPGELIAMDQDKAAVRKRMRAYWEQHPTVQTFLFATEQSEEDLILVAGGVLHASADGLDAHDVVFQSHTAPKRAAQYARFAFRQIVHLCRRFWRGTNAYQSRHG